MNDNHQHNPGREAQAAPPSASAGPARRSQILVVSRNGHMGRGVVEHALRVAERLGSSILALHVNTLPYLPDGGRRTCLFKMAMAESAASFAALARTRDIPVRVEYAAGQAGEAVRRLCHSHGPIDFVLVDQGLTVDKIAPYCPVPVFTVTASAAQSSRPFGAASPDSLFPRGAKTMSTVSKSRHIRNCFVFGTMTAAIYAAVFTYQDTIMQYFSKGGAYCLLPVAMVFAVSYAHGNFTSSFWSALGIERSQADQRPAASSVKESTVAPAPRKDVRPRAQASM